MWNNTMTMKLIKFYQLEEKNTVNNMKNKYNKNV